MHTAVSERGGEREQKCEQEARDKITCDYFIAHMAIGERLCRLSDRNSVPVLFFRECLFAVSASAAHTRHLISLHLLHSCIHSISTMYFLHQSNLLAREKKMFGSIHFTFILKLTKDIHTITHTCVHRQAGRHARHSVIKVKFQNGHFLLKRLILADYEIVIKCCFSIKQPREKRAVIFFYLFILLSFLLHFDFIQGKIPFNAQSNEREKKNCFFYFNILPSHYFRLNKTKENETKKKIKEILSKQARKKAYTICVVIYLLLWRCQAHAVAFSLENLLPITLLPVEKRATAKTKNAHNKLRMLSK